MSKLCVYLGETLGRYGFPNGHPLGPWPMESFWLALREQNLEKRITICRRCWRHKHVGWAEIRSPTFSSF